MEAQDRIQRAVFDQVHTGFDGRYSPAMYNGLFEYELHASYHARFRFESMEPKQPGTLGVCRNEAINGPLVTGAGVITNLLVRR